MTRRVVATAAVTPQCSGLTAACEPSAVPERGSDRMWPHCRSAVVACLGSGALLCGSASGQFIDDFSGPTVSLDAKGIRGWRHATGDGAATMELRQGGDGFASIVVDATRDRRNVWWALIERSASADIGRERIGRLGTELRIEARIRVSHAPRRVNLQLQTQRTTDFHSHLMEFDIPDTDNWHTLSLTTRGFDARPTDTIVAHLALMDWGLATYRVDVDYVKVDVVEAATAGPDQGDAVPYHAAPADPRSFAESVRVAQDGMIDLEHSDVRMGNWCKRDGGRTLKLRAVDASHWVILRWDLSAFAGRCVRGHGQLELTTHSVERVADEVKDFGLVRVVEILGGDPRWSGDTVTAASLSEGQPLARLLNPQPIIDWPVTEADGGKTYLAIGRPVLQRLIDGKTLGIAIEPLGAIHATFHTAEAEGGRLAPVLRFNTD
jgi:hypothetical protein